MPLLDQPFGWAWLLVIGWTGYRLLISLVLGVREASRLGVDNTSGIFGFHLIVSSIVWAIFGAVGWRMFFERAGPMGGVCFGALSGFVGLIIGFAIDMFFVIRLQHRLAVSIVAGKASTYAELLDLGDSEQRIRGAMAMAFIGPKAAFAIPQLLVGWKDRDADLRYRVALALGCTESDDPGIITAMQSGLSDSDPRVRVVAAWVLVRRKRADASVVVPILRTGLTMEDEIKNLTVDALSELGPAAADAVPDLIAMIGEKSSDTFSARYVLAAIGSPAVPALIPLLQSNSKRVRAAAIDTLAQIGPLARDALPALQELLVVSDKGTRTSIELAINKILGND